jgi:hypothetical protein
LFVVALAAAVAGSYRYGLNRAGQFGSEAERTEATLRAQLRDLEQRNDDLRAALARVERQLQIDHVAYQEIDAALVDSTHKLAELREELSFYRSIVAPRKGEGGLQIKELKLEDEGAGNRYRYRLVLIQAISHKEMVKGRASLEVAGMRDNAEEVLAVEPENGASLAVNFRYFQNLRGTLRLPDGFIPTRIKVVVTSEKKGAPLLEEWVPWPQI